MGDIIAARRRQAQVSQSNRIERVRENGHRVTEPQRKIENLLRKAILLVFSVTL
jgi:ribonuclease PH